MSFDETILLGINYSRDSVEKNVTEGLRLLEMAARIITLMPLTIWLSFIMVEENEQNLDHVSIRASHHNNKK